MAAHARLMAQLIVTAPPEGWTYAPPAANVGGSYACAARGSTTGPE